MCIKCPWSTPGSLCDVVDSPETGRSLSDRSSPSWIPVSMTASIIAVLGLAETVLEYLNDVRVASKERAECSLEVSMVYGLLTSLRYRVETSNAQDSWFTTVRTLATENGPLDQFKTALEMLSSRLRPVKAIEKIGQTLTWTLCRISWPR